MTRTGSSGRLSTTTETTSRFALSTRQPWDIAAPDGVTSLDADLADVRILALKVGHGEGRSSCASGDPSERCPGVIGGGSSEVIVFRPAGIMVKVSTQGEWRVWSWMAVAHRARPGRSGPRAWNRLATPFRKTDTSHRQRRMRVLAGVHGTLTSRGPARPAEVSETGGRQRSARPAAGIPRSAAQAIPAA